MHVIIKRNINVIRDYVRHNGKDCNVIMKYNRNVRPKHIKKKHKGNYPDAFSFLTEIIVSELLYFSVVIYKVDINIRPK